jgi:uncharacterized protein YkwD
MLGDADKAKEMLGSINKMALDTNLSGAGLRQSAQTLIGFNVAAENVVPVMQMIGDISLGNQEKFNSLALAFGQMSSAGRLMGQDLLQMINVGFNPLTEISRKTGESLSDLKKRMEAGGISTREVVEAFQSATAAGGKWHNMLNEMSGTIGARWAKLTEETGLLAMQFAEKLVPALKMTLSVGSSLVDWLSKIDASTVKWIGSISAAVYLAPKIVAGIKTIVGAYRSMTIASATLQAFTNPKAWITLAAGIGVAAASYYAIDQAFAQASDGMAQHSAAAAKAAEETKKLNLELFNGGGSGPDAAAKAMADSLADLTRRGQSLAESLRTPFEKVRDELLQARDLWDAGAISGETYARAMAKAREDLAAQAESADEIRNRLRQQNGPVAALQFGTQAANSAMNAAAREQKVNAEATKQVVQRLDKTNELLQRILRDGGSESITVNEVNL